jgi:hypothetical protein
MFIGEGDLDNFVLVRRFARHLQERKRERKKERERERERERDAPFQRKLYCCLVVSIETDFTDPISQLTASEIHLYP